MTRYFGLFLVMMLISCASHQAPMSVNQYPAQASSNQKQTIVHCFDGVPHIPGSIPVILGGTCAHSPTPEMIEIYHKEGHLLDYDWNRLKGLYESKGIKTIYDHKGCNNYCPWGPHVVKGGHCLVPPTLGTKNYEEVLSGSKDFSTK